MGGSGGAQLAEGDLDNVERAVKPPAAHDFRKGCEVGLHRACHGRGGLSGLTRVPHQSGGPAQNSSWQLQADAAETAHVVGGRVEPEPPAFESLGRRRRDGETSRRIALKVEQLRGQVDAPDAVREGVVESHHEGSPITLDPFDEGECPGRSRGIERCRRRVAGELEHLRESARGWGRHVAQMPVEVGVHPLPARAGQVQGGHDDAVPEGWHGPRGVVEPGTEEITVRAAVEQPGHHDGGAQHGVALHVPGERIRRPKVPIYLGHASLLPPALNVSPARGGRIGSSVSNNRDQGPLLLVSAAARIASWGRECRGSVQSSPPDRRCTRPPVRARP